MSVYDNEKLYPSLQPTAPPDEEAQKYRRKKIDEIDKFLRSEVAYRDNIAKRFKRRASVAKTGNRSVITATTLLGIASTATIASGVGAPVGLALASAGAVLSLSSAIMH